MKKLLISSIIAVTLSGIIAPASAHGWRGGYRGAWVPFAGGVVAGAVLVNAYYRSPPVANYGPAYYFAPRQMATYCPENGLYYPQTQTCPGGWQRVPY